MAVRTLTQYRQDVIDNFADDDRNTAEDLRTLITDLADSTLSRPSIFFWQNSNAFSTFPGTAIGQSISVRAYPASGIYEMTYPRFTGSGNRYLHIMVYQPSTIPWIGLNGATVTNQFTGEQTATQTELFQFYHSGLISGTAPIHLFVESSGMQAAT